MRRFILIPHLKIHNANAMSSPYTIGFPAMTAWLGAMHALERQLQQTEFQGVKLFKLAVSCHHLNLQTYKGQRDFVHSIISTGNPLKKNGERPSFIEEARCHLDVSLLIECEQLTLDDNQLFLNQLNELIFSMKFAGGDVLSVQAIKLIGVDDKEGEESQRKSILRSFMLGHVLIERRDLMQTAMVDGTDALSVLLDNLKINYCAQQEEKHTQEDEKGKITWTAKRKNTGWIVPIAVGFQGISDLGSALNQRDSQTPHRFAESVVTLGEFVMPYRIHQLDDMLWHYHFDSENDLYLCQNLGKY